MEGKELHIFPTLVMSFDLSDKYDKDLLVADYVHQEHGLIESENNDSGSSYGYAVRYLDNNTNFHDLKNTLQECVDVYIDKMRIMECKITNSWINLYKPGSRAKLHRHEASIISGAFYPKVIGEGAGKLKLHSPLRPYRMYDLFTSETPMNTYYQYLNPKEGMLYLFPSWCDHETEVSYAEERYVLSFNTDYTKNMPT